MLDINNFPQEPATQPLVSDELLTQAALALVDTADWNIYYTAKGHRPHIENPDECVKAVLRSSGFTAEIDAWKSEAAWDALNETVSERMQDYKVEILNAAECVAVILETYHNAPADPARSNTI